MAIQSKLEAEKQSLVESLHCLEKKLNEEKGILLFFINCLSKIY